MTLAVAEALIPHKLNQTGHRLQYNEFLGRLTEAVSILLRKSINVQVYSGPAPVSPPTLPPGGGGGVKQAPPPRGHLRVGPTTVRPSFEQ